MKMKTRSLQRGIPTPSPRAGLYAQPRVHERDGMDPPSSMTVEGEPRTVLYQADGTPLVRQIGFTP
jgi:hypothetical protein